MKLIIAAGKKVFVVSYPDTKIITDVNKIYLI